MAFALAWETDQASRCPGCGDYLEDTLDPARENAYDVELLACHRCRAGEVAMRAFRKDKNADDAGVRPHIRERAPAPSEEDEPAG